MNKNITNRVHRAIRGTSYCSCSENVPESAKKLMNFLAKKYGFYDITFVTSRVYNLFLLAMDKNDRMLFIKSGRHPELYRNEYIMERALWKLDNKHFLEPLYYSASGKYFFFANEIMNGTSLQVFADRGDLRKMPADKKMMLVRDLYKIFQVLKKSDVVHRDIRPDNFAVIGGHLVLIDLQLAVSKSNYVELESMSVGRLRGLGTRKYRYRTWQWDDSYSLLKCLKFIGCPSPEYRAEYNKIAYEIKSYIGHDVIKSSKRESAFHRIVRHLWKRKK